MPIDSLFHEIGEPRDEPWCLSFSNTVSSRNQTDSQDCLKSAEELRQWMSKSGILSQEALPAGEDPRNLERAIRLREAIYGIGRALSQNSEPEEDDVSELNWNVQRAIVAAKIQPAKTGLRWDLDSQRA